MVMQKLECSTKGCSVTTKNFYNAVYVADHPSEYAAADGPGRIAMLEERTGAWIKSSGFEGKADAKILEIGCGMAYLSDIHPGWHGASTRRLRWNGLRVRRWRR